MTTEKRSSYYEAMFLLSTAQAADFAGAIAHINEILARGHAEVVAMKKWDERRLAYEIAGNKRGVYILAYFKAPNESLSHIERDCRLSEKLMRSLILRADNTTLEEMQASDGRKELEVEAKLRAERAVTAPAEAAAPAATAEAAPQA
jgi:small subunit ribosomal protein S6